jgi:hypothetical protein
MTDQTERPEGWDAVPHVATIRGADDLPAASGPGVPAPGADAGAAAWAPPARRRLRRGAVVGIVSGAVVLVLLVVAGGVGWAVGSDAHSAGRPVEAFLDDLESGRVSSALDAAGVQHGKDDVLLTDAAYAKAGNRVTGHRIVSVSQSGDTATVDAYLTQAGRSVATTFRLERTGSDWGVFPVWELRPPSLGTVAVAVQGPPRSTVTVAGQRVRASADGTVSLRALPGSYEVGLDGGQYVSAEGQTAAVRGFGPGGTTPVQLATALTDAGKQAAAKAVDAWVDGCVASTSTEPAGCSFYAYGANPANTYTNQKWTLDSRPGVEVGGWLSKGWLVDTTTLGSATYTADFTGPAGRGTATAGPIEVSATGWITGFTASGATFEAAVGNRSSASGS